MIYYPIYEEQIDENDEIFNTVIGISIFTKDCVYDDSFQGKIFHTSSGQQIDYIGEIRDLDMDYEFLEKHAFKTLNEAQCRLIQFMFLDFK